MAEVVHSGHAGSHSDGVLGVGRELLSRGDSAKLSNLKSLWVWEWLHGNRRKTAQVDGRI